MSMIRTGILAGVLAGLPSLSLHGTRAAEPVSTTRATGTIQLAQAAPTEEEKKKREQEHKGAPPAQKTQPTAPPSAPPKAATPVVPPTVAPKAVIQVTPPPKAALPVPPVAPPAKVVTPVPSLPSPPPKAALPVPPVAPPAKIVTPVPSLPSAPIAPKAAMPAAPASSVGTAPRTGQPNPAFNAKAAVTPPPHFDQVQKGRQEHVEAGGRTVIQEPGNRVIVKQGDKVFIRHDEAERFERLSGAQTRRRPDGGVETSYMRPDGFLVITDVDANNHLLRRYRRGPDGREYSIVDNRNFWRNAGIGAGLGALGVVLALNLPPPVVTIPRERYIVDYERASDEDLYEALRSPPVDRLERAYSLEEVRNTFELRERMRRIDLDGIHFEFGGYEVTPDQYPRLERLARVMDRLIYRNPDEVFLIEGHTDAVGSDIDNLSLSDRRASAVAQVLTETFGIPPENLVTQGYGRQFLKIDTQGPERVNRRVAIRRITPLMTER